MRFPVVGCVARCGDRFEFGFKFQKSEGSGLHTYCADFRLLVRLAKTTER